MKIDRNVLIRFFSGESSDDDKQAIRQWFESNEENRRLFINERIRFDASLIVDEDEIKPIRPVNAHHYLLNILKAASVIIILVGSSYIFSRIYNKLPEIPKQTVQVPPGNRTSITLPDGTLVWLNSNTTLKYPALFSDEKRIVELNGQAYFDVKPKTDRPFLIKTSKYTIEVLGTTLDVEAYDMENTFSTSLFTGKVKLFKEQGFEQEVYLNQGETAILVGNNLLVSSHKSETYKWRDGLIVIEEKSFEEIMTLFEKYFGQKIIIQNNKLKDLGYRGKLRISDGVDHALRVLQNDFRFTYKRDEDINRIYIN
jgi:Fe2+-dicitrate sensor, membrane component